MHHRAMFTTRVYRRWLRSKSVSVLMSAHLKDQARPGLNRSCTDLCYMFFSTFECVTTIAGTDRCISGNA